MAFYDYMNKQNVRSVSVAQDEDKLDKKGCQLCASEKEANAGECKWCAKDALVKELIEGEETVSPNGEAEGTVIAVKDEDKFDEEKHPRGEKGSKEGGRFVKSEKTIEKEDNLEAQPDEYDQEGRHIETSRKKDALIQEFKKIKKSRPEGFLLGNDKLMRDESEFQILANLDAISGMEDALKKYKKDVESILAVLKQWGVKG